MSDDRPEKSALPAGMGIRPYSSRASRVTPWGAIELILGRSDGVAAWFPTRKQAVQWATSHWTDYAIARRFYQGGKR